MKLHNKINLILICNIFLLFISNVNGQKRVDIEFITHPEDTPIEEVEKLRLFAIERLNALLEERYIVELTDKYVIKNIKRFRGEEDISYEGNADIFILGEIKRRDLRNSLFTITLYVDKQDGVGYRSKTTERENIARWLQESVMDKQLKHSLAKLKVPIDSIETDNGNSESNRMPPSPPKKNLCLEIKPAYVITGIAALTGMSFVFDEIGDNAYDDYIPDHQQQGKSSKLRKARTQRTLSFITGAAAIVSSGYAVLCETLSNKKPKTSNRIKVTPNAQGYSYLDRNNFGVKVTYSF